MLIPYGRHSINDDDIDAVVQILRHKNLTQGEAVSEFEKHIANACRVHHAVAVTNATSALHIAYLSLGVQKNDIVWTSPITFVASATAALMCGAIIDFVDICPDTYNLSVEALKRKLEQARKSNELPKVVCPVHFAGQSCDMEGIYSLSREYGFRILEDAAHAIGGTYLDRPIGTCAYSDICVFSFHPVKIITTGEGGIATTNDAALAANMRLLREHGITRDRNCFDPNYGEDWSYQQLELGFNYRMTDIQAALGISQLTSLEKFVAQRNKLFDRYTAVLGDFDIKLPFLAAGRRSSWHLFVVQIITEQVGKSRNVVLNSLHELGIGAQVHYIPVYRQPYFQRLGFPYNYCPVSEAYYDQALTLPLYPDLSFEKQDIVIDKLKVALSR